MRYRDLIEMPIADFQKVGAFNGSSRDRMFQNADDRLLDSTKGIEKIHNAFAKTKFDFNIYVVMPSAAVKASIENGPSMTFEKEKLNQILGREVETEGRITVVYMNNFTGSNPKPFTAWTFAHRMGHGIQVRKEYNTIETQIVQTVLDLYNTIQGTDLTAKPSGLIGSSIPGVSRRDHHEDIVKLLTMKSARDGKFNTIALEMFCELLAQHLISGRVRLARPEGFEDAAERSENKINGLFEELLGMMVGKIVSF